MAKQERIQKPKQTRDSKGRYTKADEPQERTEETTDLLDKTDDLMAEIDAALDDVLGETSAQEFVGNYIQKGGE